MMGDHVTYLPNRNLIAAIAIEIGYVRSKKQLDNIVKQGGVHYRWIDEDMILFYIGKKKHFIINLTKE